MSKKGFFKKTAAVAAAGAMLVSCTGTAWAGAYADAEKANLEAKTDIIAEQWEKELDEAEGATAGNADIALYLADTGRAMVSMLSGLDISWLDCLGIKMDFSVNDGSEKAILNLYANDQDLASMLMDIDLAGQVVKAMIPEISGSALTAPMEVEVDGAEDSQQAMKIYMDILKDPKAVLPDGTVIKDLYNRYGAIIFDHMADGATEEGTLSVDGVEEAYTLTEGVADAEAFVAIAQDILTTAKDDEQIAQIVKNVEAASEDLAGLYDKMQAGIEETLDDLATSELPADTSISSKLYTNADGKVIGREISFNMGDEGDAMVTYKAPSNGEKTGFELAVTSDGETYGIAGSGTVAGDVANGVYNIMANGVALASANVENLDLKEGKSGTITLALNENMPDEDTYAVVGSIVITITLGSESEDSSYIDLALSYAGSDLGSIRITGKEGGETVDVSALDAAANVYDTENDDDMAAFAGEISLDNILSNLTAAGAPEGFAENLISLIEGGGDDYADYDYDDYDYDYEDAEETVSTDAAA